MADTITRERSPQQLAEQARGKANDVLSGFTTGQKTTTALAILALLAAGMFFMRWVSEPSMAPLFTNLEAEDAAAITDELTARGVDYELSDGGRTVMVPRSDQLGLRLDMSSAGLVPSNTAGYSLLDENGIMRDLSGVIGDIAGDALNNETLAKLNDRKKARNLLLIASHCMRKWGGHACSND